MVKKWIESREKAPESDYEEAKRKFEMAMGQPYITLKVEMPVGFDGLTSDFLKLENDSQFHDEVRDLVKKRLLLDSHHKKNLESK